VRGNGSLGAKKFLTRERKLIEIWVLKIGQGEDDRHLKDRIAETSRGQLTREYQITAGRPQRGSFAFLQKGYRRKKIIWGRGPQSCFVVGERGLWHENLEEKGY